MEFKFISTIINKFKIKEIVSIFFFSSLILTILPDNFLENLALLTFKNSYKTIISLILIITSSYYLFNLIKTLKIIILNKIFPDHKIYEILYE